MGRDGMLSGTLYRTNRKHRTPYVGINILIAVSALIFAGCFGLKAIDVGRYAATAGILTLLLSYMLATICAVVFFKRSKILRGGKLIASGLSICILGAIFILNIYPVPEYPVNRIICGIFFWLIAGIFLSMRIKSGLGEQ
jgi:amino acid transporter